MISAAGCSKDFLETGPTDSTSGEVIFENAESALCAINGMYRAMYKGNWTSNWEPENGGITAYTLIFDLYAEDHIMDSQGSGWFYYDYAYNTWGDYDSNASHSYGIWNFFYTLICNANYVIANETDLTKDGAEIPADWKYVLGQAYAIRSYAYMFLVQAYQQNGGPANDARRQLPGVPLYTEPTVAGSEGHGRGTVQNVYDQANTDIDKAIKLLSECGKTQMHPSHIDLNVAYGLKARTALVQRDYAAALAAAEAAMDESKVWGMGDVKEVNDAAAKNVMWGLAVQSDQSIQSWDIFDHMSADGKSTYSAARHLIANWLYNQIPAGDVRLAWWTPEIPEETWGEAGTENGSFRSWCQKKIVWKDAATSVGDHILMREEEMYLIAAEAACHLSQFSDARKYISVIGNNRMGKEEYGSRLAGFTDSNKYNDNTVANLVTLMDEILFQRRVELWSENPRMFDLQRLDLGFHRDWDGSNHTEPLNYAPYNTNAHSPQFIFWIPQAEFDGNENMDPAKDQNPAMY